MRVIKTSELPENRKVEFHAGVSNRILLEEDGMGYTMTKTVISPSAGKVFQHYKNHLETCYCVSGKATLTNTITGEEFSISADTTYVLDKNDPHNFEAHEETTLICTFNPPLTGNEVHQEDGSYDSGGFISPVYDVKRVPIEKITSNDYNPNSVAPPEMALLETSIWEDGYTQPVVVVYDNENDEYIVVDGFHRYCVLRDSKRINEREGATLPVVVLQKEIHDRMASTIRHNRARGSHNIELMSTIVSELVEMGKGDSWICNHIGMSKDELLRLKQITGVASLFQNQDFSDSWDAENAGEVFTDETK
jgi:ParB-like chromosome segregation protein Spo0J/quercetin dioxygenase-like cupin family protein